MQSSKMKEVIGETKEKYRAAVLNEVERMEQGEMWKVYAFAVILKTKRKEKKTDDVNHI